MADRSISTTNKAIIGAGVAAAAGAAAFLLARRTGSGGVPVGNISDAPDHVWRRGTERYDPELLGNTVTIGRPAQELYDAWRDLTRFPAFMENVERVEMLDDKSSLWTIKAPAGTTVDLVTRISEDVPGKAIAWLSEPESEIHTEGRVEFIEAPPERGTYVRLTQRYSSPGGI